MVLVSGHYQLGSVDAGGLFRLLATDIKPPNSPASAASPTPWEAQPPDGSTTATPRSSTSTPIRTGSALATATRSSTTPTKPGPKPRITGSRLCGHGRRSLHPSTSSHASPRRTAAGHVEADLIMPSERAERAEDSGGILTGYGAPPRW